MAASSGGGPSAPHYDDPFRRRPPAAERGLAAKLDRPLRLAALLTLCLLVWWFSYDQGRSSLQARVVSLERENKQLQRRAAVLEESLGVLREMLAQEGRTPRKSQDGGQNAGPDAGPEAEPRNGLVAAPEAGPSGPPEAAGASDGPLAPSETAGRSAPVEGVRGWLAVKTGENRGAFGGRVVVTLLELDSFEPEAVVRLHFVEDGRRETRTLRPGDVFELELDGAAHSLYLDRLKGTLAFFIVDGLPAGS
ncbi:MAG: hypothetical protein LBU12_03085 [Deltaproteobacteria bacterium]|jgi:hypothetical protein|nr:hypothetical protein [Deltaproteobacteria bacterium]